MDFFVFLTIYTDVELTLRKQPVGYLSLGYLLAR